MAKVPMRNAQCRRGWAVYLLHEKSRCQADHSAGGHMAHRGVGFGVARLSVLWGQGRIPAQLGGKLGARLPA